jgi:succinoglycan biosynthesis transport protein ExoP
MLDHTPPSRETSPTGLQQLLRLLRLLWLRRTVVVTALVATGALGGLYYATAPRIYEADAQILLVDSQRESLSTSLTAGRDELTAMATYEKLLSSPLVLRSAVELLDPEIRALMGGSDVDMLVDRIAKGLRIRGLRQTNILELRFRSAQPAVPAGVLSAVVQAYATFMEEAHRGKAGTLVETLGREKEAVEAKLQAKQSEFLEIRQRVGDLGIKTDGKTLHPLVERAIQLNAALVDTQKKRLALQATHTSLVESLARGDDMRQSLMAVEETLGREVFLESMGFGDRNKETRVALEKQLIEDRAQLDTLLQFYGEQHPRVIERRKKIEQVQIFLEQVDRSVAGTGFAHDDTKLAAAVEQILRQRLDATVQHERSLQTSFEEAKAESAGFASEVARLDIVENDLHWLRDLRNTILGQIASIDLRQEHGGVKMTIVRDPVVPLDPIAPQLRLTVLLAIAGGLALGVTGVLVIDTLDDRVRSGADLEHDIGVRLLAAIGDLDAVERRADDATPAEGLEAAHMWRGDDDASSEGFRTLRTVIVMTDGEMRRISVSSSEPGDGKTTVGMNLAIAYQQAGRRVLLIDGDLRKPGLTTALGMRSAPGLADVLVGTVSVAEAAAAVIRRSGDVPIDVIPSGRRPANPGELLLSPRFADLLGWADTEYDQIIVDAPPVLVGTDAAAIGNACDGMVLVIRPEKNSRHVLRKAIETLRTFQVRLLGAVVNGVGLENSGYGYGYGYGYGSGYGDRYGHETGDEIEANADDGAEPGGDARPDGTAAEWSGIAGRVDEAAPPEDPSRSRAA